MKQLLISAICIAALSACGGGSSGMTSTPGTATDLCNGTAVPEFTLVSPASGSMSVADSTSALVFSGTLYNQTGATESIRARCRQTEPSYSLTTFNATAADTMYRYQLWPAGTTYNVNYVITNNAGAQACETTIVSEGSFTTQ